MLLGGYRDSRENPNSQIAEIAGLDIDGLEKSGRENGGLPALWAILGIRIFFLFWQ